MFLSCAGIGGEAIAISPLVKTGALQAILSRMATV